MYNLHMGTDIHLYMCLCLCPPEGVPCFVLFLSPKGSFLSQNDCFDSKDMTANFC